MRGGSSFRLPGPEHLGGWVALALMVALVLHVVLFFTLGQIRVALGLAPDPDVAPRILMEQVEIAPPPFDQAPEDTPMEAPPKDSSALLDEIDLLDIMPKDTELDIRPDVVNPEIALRLQTPALDGELLGEMLKPVPGPMVAAEIENLGRMEETLTPSAGQVIVDPGEARADLLDPDEFNEQLMKKGAEGAGKNGVMEGYTSLDDMLNLPGNDLTNTTGMIGSDLLFDYNSPVLRESARVSMLKVARLLDLNPEMFCIIDGHTDMFGGEEFNVELSRKRAEAVRDYLMGPLRLSTARIIVRGRGKAEPLVKSGSVEEQALNRRVEIKMRTEPPSDEPVLVKPRRQPTAADLGQAPVAKPVIETPAPVIRRESPPVVESLPPRAVPIEDGVPARALRVEAPPARALPLDESWPPPPPRAQRVEEEGPARAVPVEEEGPARAVPVEEPGAARALPVGEDEP
jgi:outer membrane protein OmpA-like peptidoglycan-associated protein